MKKDMKFLPILWGLTAMAATAAFTRGQAGRESSSPTKPSSGNPADRRGHENAPGGLSESDCRAFGESVIKAVEAGHREEFNALMDWDTLLEKAAADWDLPENSRHQAIEILRKSMDAPAGFTSQRLRESEQGATLRVLQTRQREGRPAVLFRMLGQGGELNYFEFVLHRLPGGPVRAMDVHIYSTAELFSETLRRLALPVIAVESRTPIDRLSPADRDYLHDLAPLKRASEILAQGQPKEALAVLKTLRPTTQERKDVLLTRLRAADQGGDDKEGALVRKVLRTRFPDNPFLAVFAIDPSEVKKDFPGAMKDIDRLERAVGGDPYLDVTRASACEARGDLQEARRFARRALEREPSLLPSYWALVEYSLKAEKYGETLERLKEIDQKFDLEFGDLSQVPVYAGFIGSPQYREWLDYLRKKHPPQDQESTRNNPEATPTARGPLEKGSP